MTLPVPVLRKFWIPPGDLGTMATLDAMAGLARQDAGHPLTTATVFAILGSRRFDTSPPPSDSWGTANLLRDWLAAHFAFLSDPVGVGVFGAPGEDIELVRSPVVLLDQAKREFTIRGDCDDAATLGACLSLAAGMPCRFRVVGFVPNGPFAHVFTEVLTAHGWRDLDVTRPAAMLPRVYRTATFRV